MNHKQKERTAKAVFLVCIVVGVGYLLVDSLFFLEDRVASQATQRDEDFKERGVHTLGEVVEDSIDTTWVGRGRERREVYQFSYKVKFDGHTIRTKTPYPRSWEVGDKVPMTYLPGKQHYSDMGFNVRWHYVERHDKHDRSSDERWKREAADKTRVGETVETTGIVVHVMSSTWYRLDGDVATLLRRLDGVKDSSTMNWTRLEEVIHNIEFDGGLRHKLRTKLFSDDDQPPDWKVGDKVRVHYTVGDSQSVEVSTIGMESAPDEAAKTKLGEAAGAKATRK